MPPSTLPPAPVLGFDAKRAFANPSGLGNYSRDHLRLCRAYFPNAELRLFAPKITGPFADFAHHWPATEVITPAGGLKGVGWRHFGLTRALQRADVTIFHGLSAALPWGIHRWQGRKVVTIHDLIFEKYPQYYPPLDRLIYRAKTRYALRVADVVVAISHETSDDLVAHYGADAGRIRVIYQSCHQAFRQSAPDAASQHRVVQAKGLPPRYALYVGTLEARKHLGALLAAVGHCATLPLVVVGRRTAYFERLRAQASRLQARGLLFFVTATTDELAILYRKAVFLAYPSEAEGFGIPIIEALFSDIPVLGGSSPCLREAGGEGGLYVDPRRPDQLTAAYHQLSQDEALRARLVAAGQQHRARFQPEMLARQWQSAYFS